MNTKTVKEKVEKMIEEELRTMGAIIVSWNGISPMYYVADKIDKLYKKEVMMKIDLIKVRSKKEHICRFNDGEQNCECYLEGINRIKRQISHNKLNK